MTRPDVSAQSTAHQGATRRAAGRIVLASIAATVGMGLAGCIVAPVGPRHGPPPPGYGGGPGPGPAPGGYPQAPVEGPVVTIPPPQPQYEVVPVAPVSGWIWIGGYWTWHLGRHVWVGGRWTAPVAGHVWVGPRWVQVGPGGWRHHGGYWRRG